MVTGGLALTAPAAAQSSTLVVDDDGMECDEDHNTIQAAVSAASADDTIEVCDGTYQESVTIPADKDGLTLEATGDATIVGEGIQPSDVASDRPHAAIHVAATSSGATLSDVTIRNFTIENPSGTYGIFAGWGGGGADVTGLTVADNTIQDIGTDLAAGDTGWGNSPPLAGAVTGLYVRANYDGISVTDNTVQDVSAPSNVPGRSAGLSFSSFVENKPAFADGEFAADTVVEGNTITGISGEAEPRAKGISVSGEFDGFTIADNSIDAVETPGRGLGVSITENPNGGDIDGDGLDERVGPRNFEIRNNVIQGVDADAPSALFVGGYEDLGDDHAVRSNSLIGPVERFHADQPGFQIEDADRLDATANWWGSPLGPAHDDNEFGVTGLTGSTVGDFVDYEPWCPTENCLLPILQSVPN